MRAYGRVDKKNVCECKCCWDNRHKLNVKQREREQEKLDIREEIEFNYTINKSLAGFYNRKRLVTRVDEYEQKEVEEKY